MVTPRKPAAAAATPKPIRAWLTVISAYHLCDAAMVQRLAPLGLKLAEHEVLVNVAREPGISQQALAARCFTAKSHVSALVVALEQRGWLLRERDPLDGRARRLQLTAAGRAKAQQALAVQAGVVKAMTEAVTPEELRVIEQAMSRVNQHLISLLDAG